MKNDNNLKVNLKNSIKYEVKLNFFENYFIYCNIKLV